MAELSIDEAYARDYRAKRRFDEVARAIETLLADDDARHWLGVEETALREARARCENTSASIVQVWD
jgi:hypothetical protein